MTKEIENRRPKTIQDYMYLYNLHSLRILIFLIFLVINI